MILVTAYESPDLDGSACAYAYAEFLNKTGTSAVAAISGEMHKEANFVFDKFNIPKLPNAEDFVASSNGIVLVDSSELLAISNKIEPKKVIEIIDHRKANDAAKFLNAKLQIELVGSCATLISERFYMKGVEPSKESAILLYSAIVSNTINFKNNITSNRDRKMAEYLKSKIELPKNYVSEMFAFKSKLDGSLEEIFDADLAKVRINGKLFIILQLEINGVEEFAKKNMPVLEAVFGRIKKKESADYIFATLIDIEKAFNLFICFDDETKVILENALKIKFTRNLSKREGILMRKEIIPKLKESFVGN